MEVVNDKTAQLFKSIKGEADVDVLWTMVEALTTIVGMMGPPAVSVELMSEASKALSMLLIESDTHNFEC